MWRSIFKFEIAYRLKRLDTYVFFIFLFLFSIVSVDFIYGGVDLGPVKKNAPIIIAKSMGALTGITMIIASLIMGVPVLRDFEYQIASLIYVNPIKKRDYLLGKFLGSFVILLLVFSSVIWGNILGAFMPWRNPEDQVAFNFLAYLQPFFTVVVPILFFGAALFFVSGALSRKLIVVYTQGLFLFVLFMITRGIENEYLGAILDPFTLNTLTEMTKDWSTDQLNLERIPFSGVLFYSKLFWALIGGFILAFGYRQFNYNVVSSKRPKKSNPEAKPHNSIKAISQNLPSVNLKQNLRSQSIQLLQHSLFYFKTITKEVSFWAIIICAIIIIFVNSISLGTLYGVDSYPATYFIVEELLELSGYFFIIVMVFYSGELIWKERSIKLHMIYDALPSSDFINLAGKFLGLNLVYMVLMLSIILAGIVFQISQGYYAIDLQHYLVSFFVDFLAFLSLFTILSFFIHVLVNKKFVAYAVVLGVLILLVALPLFGYNHNLYTFGGSNIGTYSEMNGYGQLLEPFLWFKGYWFVIGLLMLIVASTLSVRGLDSNFIARLKHSKFRYSRYLRKVTVVLALLTVILGSYIYYNTNVLNNYWTTSEKLAFRVSYEQHLKQFEYLAQPKITDVNLKLELYPNTQDYVVEGYYMLKNLNDHAISEIHIQKLIDDNVSLDTVDFDMASDLDLRYENFGYYIYHLSQALQPGATIKMNFKQSFRTSGFENSNSNTKIVSNGTFFNNQDFPTLGYRNKYEIRDASDREAMGLLPRKGMATKTDQHELKYAINGDDGYRINFEMIIGTAIDQTAIAPGLLVGQWTENDRSYFHYKMERPMINFYSIVSAKYALKEDIWQPEHSQSKPIALEIYHHPEHDYNIDRMMASMKASFDYYIHNFGPYAYGQMRIMEFPRYAEFAQSFPTVVPFSEALGFMLDIDDTTDVDMAFYITAHELAHQWWGLQVVAANVQGRHMILETLSQYSAVMVLKQQYGEAKVKQFLEGELEAYTLGKSKETEGEPSLALVETQDYVYYNKGAINMYALQEQIGEDKVNLALRRFVRDWNVFNPEFDKERYATTDDLLSYFREVTPDHLQHVITELFETNTLPPKAMIAP